MPVPRYPSLSLGLPSPPVEGAIRLFRPDVVHLASPFALGAHGAAVAGKLGIPVVAVYQTDVAVRMLADDGAKLGPAGTVRAAVMRPTPLSSSAGQDRA